MHYPYTSQPLDALMAAQSSAGLVLGATLWAKQVRPWASTALLLGAIGLVVVLPVEGDFWRGLGATLDPEHSKHVLKLAAAMAAAAAISTRQRWLAVIAVAGEIALWVITNFIQDCDWDLAAAHLAFFGLLIGLAGSMESVAPAEPPASDARRPLDLHRAFWRDDAILFVVATAAATWVCALVMHGRTNSADEWANTFQAALFAKLHAYGSVPRCAEALRSFYVFQYMGRSFAQYTPGWPYFMAPFVALRVPWLAGPASLGLLAVGVARLGRRATSAGASGDAAASLRHARIGGTFAAMAVILSTTVLINGASRYPHIFVCALFAWALEALCVVATPGLPAHDQTRWGSALGGAAALMLAARPTDGATLGLGLLVYFGYALARRRIGWRAVAAAVAVAAVIGGITLIVLRLQLGTWFKTGYALGDAIYPWNKVTWSLPKPNQYRAGIPLASGSYCWWPCAPSVGLAGLALTRGREWRLGFVFLISSVSTLTLYTLCDLGRNYDFGYGPRYELILIVPMGVGTGVVLARLWAMATNGAVPGTTPLAAGGPAAIALAAVGLGVLRIAPLIYPYNYADVEQHNRLHEAIDRMGLHNAVVFAGSGLNNTDPMDLTENMPLELYPDPDVIIAIDRGPDETRCVREQYPGREFYLAIRGDPVRLIQF